MLWIALALLACKAGADAVDTGDSESPGVESCDGEDNDGDGLVDEGLGERQTWYLDRDRDGWGDVDQPLEACSRPADYSLEPGDCDDGDSDVNPDAVELCNGVDDDCDGVVDDADAPPPWYLDEDGDGYGDGDPVGSCDPIEGRVERGGDCNDQDPEVHPGATEVCNGVDDDCDEAVTEDGSAWFLSDEGRSWVDWTERMAGADGAPETVVVTNPGSLHVCPGTHYSSLRVRADLAIRGFGEGVRISGGGARGVLILRTDGLTVSVADLTLEGGEGSGAVLGEYSAGGAIECAANSTLSLESVILSDSAAGVGGGLYNLGCSISMTGGEITGNRSDYHGGGVAVLSGDLGLDQVRVANNEAAYGAGLAVVSYDGEAEVELVDSIVRDNIAARSGGGALVEDGFLSCTADPALSAGFMANSAESGGGVELAGAASLSSVDCDWGVGADENLPGDVSSSSGSFSDDETFTCDLEGCTR